MSVCNLVQIQIKKEDLVNLNVVSRGDCDTAEGLSSIYSQNQFSIWVFVRG